MLLFHMNEDHRVVFLAFTQLLPYALNHCMHAAAHSVLSSHNSCRPDYFSKPLEAALQQLLSTALSHCSADAFKAKECCSCTMRAAGVLL
jgi:hypothetical protein